ncbi:hypothetical protein D3C73_1373250 [compost metagenome]
MIIPVRVSSLPSAVAVRIEFISIKLADRIRTALRIDDDLIQVLQELHAMLYAVRSLLSRKDVEP